MAVEAYKTSYSDKYAFQVEIGGFVRAGFSKVSGLEENVEIIEYHEGGHLRGHKSPGKVSCSDVTLERGETDDNDLYNLWKKVYDAAKESGGVQDEDYKLDITIKQLDRSKKVIKSWNLFGTWPHTFGVDDWDATSSEKHIEKIVLAVDYIEKV